MVRRNAATFRLRNGSGQHLAVRCFTRPVADRGRRLTAIANFLQAQTDPIFTRISYVSEGILVEGNRYPLVKMPWIAGDPLHKYIHAHVNQVAAIESLLKQFVALVERLEKLGIAHGDLQHGNIMVSNGQLVLIDYDAMYLPALAGLRSPESGHENYQHPERNDQYGTGLDRFSSIVIYLALKALTLKPALWTKYSPGGENLLFKRSDFLAPDKSPLFKELAALPGLGLLVERFKQVCKGGLDQVPRLTDLVGGVAPQAIPSRTWIPVRRTSQYPVLAANARDALMAHMGQRVAVVGQITTTHPGRDKYCHRPYHFLNFGDYRAGCFTLVLWSDALEEFERNQKNPTEYQWQWVQVTGVLTYYDPVYRPGQPQIEIESPLEIEVLSGGDEARQRLNAALSEPTVSPGTIPPLLLFRQTPGITVYQKPNESWQGYTRLSYLLPRFRSPLPRVGSRIQERLPAHPSLHLAHRCRLLSNLLNRRAIAKDLHRVHPAPFASRRLLSNLLNRRAIARYLHRVQSRLVQQVRDNCPQKHRLCRCQRLSDLPIFSPGSSVSQTTIDLGHASAFGLLSKPIEITNAGSGTLQVVFLEIPPGVSVEPVRINCGPGESKTATVTLRSSLVPASALQGGQHLQQPGSDAD